MTFDMMDFLMRNRPHPGAKVTVTDGHTVWSGTLMGVERTYLGPDKWEDRLTILHLGEGEEDEPIDGVARVVQKQLPETTEE